MLVFLHGRRLQSFKEGGDHSTSTISLQQGTPQSMHHGRSRRRVGADNNIPTIGKAEQRIDISLMGMSRQWIHKENNPPQILDTHQCCNLGISPQRTRSARQPIMNGRIILPPHRLTHLHRSLRAGNTKLLEDLRISFNELLHGRLHVIMRHKCQLAHLAGGKCGCEGCCDFICCGADCVGEGEALGVGGASALGGATVVVELDGEGFTAAHG
mmetsp:Transcript_12668/g.21473  ORF Transcript_12668/g.21473 Transcript_12668/m.21473 type:complete len:213 (+) Transcript_12668:469-1107(+)